MLDETGCDGIMVARGSLGNPWIFKAIEEYISHGKYKAPPDLDEKLAVLKRHLEYIQRYRSATALGNVSYSRKVVIWYMKSFDRAASFRAGISRIKTYEEMLRLIDQAAPAKP